MSSKGLKLDLKLCPGLLLPTLMKDEECEGMLNYFLQEYFQKKTNFEFADTCLQYFLAKESGASCFLLLLLMPKCRGG